MSEQPKKKYDMNRPEARALIDEIVHGTFMKEGTIAAFPTCFPGATIPIPADESHITALAVSPDGMVYGGTGGRAVHLFVGIFHGVTGIVFDRGVVPEASRCVAVCCGNSNFAACVNGPDGGRVIISAFQGLPFDLIQEWGFSRPALKDLGRVNGEPIVHAVADETKTFVIGTTTNHLFRVPFDGEKIELIGEVHGNGRLAVGSKGSIFGRDTDDWLWRYRDGKLEREALKIPAGAWGRQSLTWAKDVHSGLLYTADSEGNLYSLDEERGFSEALGRTLLKPVGPMAVTHDGRLFGFCGSEMAKMFCYDPQIKKINNLGVAVSFLERRRYGYVFGDAATGRDGQIFFGEDDDLGHLWIYFPKIQPHGPGVS